MLQGRHGGNLVGGAPQKSAGEKKKSLLRHCNDGPLITLLVPQDLAGFGRDASFGPSLPLCPILPY